MFGYSSSPENSPARSRRAACLLPALLVSFALSALAMGAGGADADAESTRITLHFHYRDSVESGDFTEKTAVVTLSARPSPLEIDKARRERIDFERIYVQLVNADASFVLHFFDRDNDQLLQSILYQFTDAPVNVFAGHGMTGLHYVYHRAGAELQFWARVAD